MIDFFFIFLLPIIGFLLGFYAENLTSFHRHKWVSERKKATTLRRLSYTEDVIVERQQCEKCGKRRGRVHPLEGRSYTIDEGFIE